jgi:hypothetical protein
MFDASPVGIALRSALFVGAESGRAQGRMITIAIANQRMVAASAPRLIFEVADDVSAFHRSTDAVSRLARTGIMRRGKPAALRQWINAPVSTSHGTRRDDGFCRRPRTEPRGVSTLDASE